MNSRDVGRGGWTLLLILAVGFVALLSVWPLSFHWAADPQYHFGYFVPFLAALLAWRRWTSRPSPDAPSRRAALFAVGLVLLFPPAWFLLQPNPDWRLLNWAVTGGCVAFLISLAATLGGCVWAKHFAFPACFLLAGVPWPTELEWPVTQGLMRGVASTAAELLSLASVPAIAQGNLVEIAQGTLGVDLACSGIRSLQPSLMMALFLGELFRFDLSRRFALLLASIAIAFITNLGRVLVLAGVAVTQGLPAIDRWHDPAGGVLMTICFTLVWGTALLLGRSHSLPGLSRLPATPPMPRRVWPTAGIVWIAISVFAAERWYRRAAETHGTPWTFTAPATAEPAPIAADARAMLRFDRGGGWKWKTGPAREWIAYDMSWDPGPTRSRMLLSMHRPDICLAAVGLRLIEDRGVVTMPLVTGPARTSIPFQAYVFDSPHGPLHVYYALYRDGQPVLERESSVRSACFRAVAERRRVLDQRVLQLAATGHGDAPEADRALAAVLLQTITTRPETSPR